jgi:2',3'-cyclic-nucleotide 2'-phosphodiesterase (5'-nucleotidase family)
VFPYNNQVVTAEITGQILLDLLEMAVARYPEEDGSFPSMSGVTFSINTSIPTSVKIDENGLFTGVEGERRVYGVKVLDSESGEYRDLELDRKYVFAGLNYHVISLGSGMAMLKDAKLIDGEGTLDIELLERYIVDYLGGVIGEEYAAPQGRITYTEGYVG